MQPWTAEVIARMGLNHPGEWLRRPSNQRCSNWAACRLTGCRSGSEDGTMIDTDNADALPSALSLDGAPGEAVIVLALPLMQANGGNCLKPEEVAERPVRFRQRWRDVRNQFGDDTRQIAVIQPELTLRFAHRGQQRLPDLSACSPAAGLAGGTGLSTRRFSRRCCRSRAAAGWRRSLNSCSSSSGLV